MSDDHRMTKEDKLILTITLGLIFFGVFALDVVDFFGTVFAFDAVILFSPSTYSKSKNLSFSCCAH